MKQIAVLFFFIIMIGCDNNIQRRFDLNNSPVHKIEVDGNTIFNDQIKIDITGLSAIDESGGGEGDENNSPPDDYTEIEIEVNRLDNLPINNLNATITFHFTGRNQTVNLNSNTNYIFYDRKDAVGTVDFKITCYNASYEFTWEPDYREYNNESVAYLNHTGYFYENN